MNWLSSTAHQLRELFLAMTPATRVASVLLGVVVVVSMMFLVRGTTPSADEFLFGGEVLPGDRVAAIEKAFAQADLNQYETDGNRIKVPASLRHKYMAAIADAGAMPTNLHDILNAALDGGGLWESPEAKRRRVKAARERQLAMIIREMEGIQKAAVIFHEKNTRRHLGVRSERVVTAMVSVKPTSNDALDGGRVRMIRLMVASAIGGKYEDVTVQDLASGRSFGGGAQTSDGLAGGGEDAFYAKKTKFEDEVRRKIERRLSHIPGVIVEVRAELDPIREEVKRDHQVDPQPVALVSSTNEEETTSTDAQVAGRPGTGSNVAVGPAGAAPPTATPGQQNATKSSTETQQNTVGFEETVVKKEGHTPKEVYASIGIPSDYWVQVFKQQNREADGTVKEPTKGELQMLEETERPDIENAVTKLLGPVDEGENPYPRVHVATFQSLSAEEIPDPSMVDKAGVVLAAHGKTLVMVGVALIALLMLRSMLKALPVPTAAADSAAFSFEFDDDSEQHAEEGEEDRARLKLNKGPSLKDDLSELVREDPDAAASIIRSWIGNAA